jgi:biopolymer transport protein ExbB
LYIRKTARLDEDFLHKINDMLQAGNVQGAINFCKSTSFPIAKLLEKGLSRLGSPIRDIEAAIENKAKVEIYNMEKNLGILSAIARIAPMFGFLGTVTGRFVPSIIFRSPIRLIFQRLRVVFMRKW